MFRTWLESSTWDDLYWSAVAAFPNTTRRQHVTGPIEISNMRFTPFIGMKTLLLRSEAFNPETNKEYSPIVLFKQVQYEEGPNAVHFVASDDGNEYTMNRLSLENNECLVRCPCLDFFYRFHFYDWRDKSLWGPNRKPYESQGGPPANPMELEGACKHLMKSIQALEEMGLIA